MECGAEECRLVTGGAFSACPGLIYYTPAGTQKATCPRSDTQDTSNLDEARIIELIYELSTDREELLLLEKA